MNLPSQAPATSANPEQARVQLVETSIVFVANQLNLSIFNPLWFVKQGILREDEFTAETVITPAFVQIPTSGFNLLIIPDRLQMQLLPRTFPIAANEFHRVLGGIIKSLPHTPLKGVGLNFSFMSVPPKGTAFEHWNPLLYAAPCIPSSADIAVPTARFGGYFSLDIFDMRLKVTMMPVKIAALHPLVADPFPDEPEKQHLSLNYQKEFSQQPTIEDVIAIIEKWKVAHIYANNVVSSISNYRAKSC